MKRRRYYPKDGSFATDGLGNQVYVRDGRGNEVYPERDREVFARDRDGRFYYARDAAGNEYYPVRNGRSLFLTDATRIRLAVTADGTQRYPSDARGNEYYWKEDDGPFLLRRSTGERYLARSKNGRELVPWNHMREFVGDEPCVFSRDAAGNTVYVKESDFPQAFKALVRCLCHVSVICPNVTGCHTRLT